jgi:hypothetical protein
MIINRGKPAILEALSSQVRSFPTRLEPIDGEMHQADQRQQRPTAQGIAQQQRSDQRVDSDVKSKSRGAANLQAVNPIRLQRKIGDQVRRAAFVGFCFVVAGAAAVQAARPITASNNNIRYLIGFSLFLGSLLNVTYFRFEKMPSMMGISMPAWNKTEPQMLFVFCIT